MSLICIVYVILCIFSDYVYCVSDFIYIVHVTYVYCVCHLCVLCMSLVYVCCIVVVILQRGKSPFAVGNKS
jgi:hypothetical protein